MLVENKLIERSIMKVAEGLLLRKQLEAKVKQLEPVKQLGENGLFEIKTTRTQVAENVDEVKFQIPRVEIKEVTAEYDHYASELRKLDTAIQQANWVNDLDYNQTPKK